MKAMAFDVGNTHVEIWDDCVINDAEIVEEILERVGQIGIKIEISEQENSPSRAATLTRAM